MIQINALNKKFGKLHVLKNIDIAIESGETVAIVGPNSSGKTTLIKTILGLVRPQSGQIIFRGQYLNGSCHYRKYIGYMPQLAQFPENLTIAEVLNFIKRLRQKPYQLDEDLYYRFNLEKDISKPIRTLSGGTRQKLNAVIAFLFDPELYIMDEPTAGLDPMASSYLKDKINGEKAKNKTFILTSHIMSELEELADRVIFLLEGKIHYDGTLTDLKAETGQINLERAIAHLMENKSFSTKFSEKVKKSTDIDDRPKIPGLNKPAMTYPVS